MVEVGIETADKMAKLTSIGDDHVAGKFLIFTARARLAKRLVRTRLVFSHLQYHGLSMTQKEC